jgi:hypothetical protein
MAWSVLTSMLADALTVAALRGATGVHLRTRKRRWRTRSSCTTSSTSPAAKICPPSLGPDVAVG